MVDTYSDVLSEAYTARMAAKMGLAQYDKPLTVGLITLMYEDKADFTNTFRALASVGVNDAPGNVPAPLAEARALVLHQECPEHDCRMRRKIVKQLSFEVLL